jgi:predicted nuclease of predicted toxin-antitoxin system
MRSVVDANLPPELSSWISAKGHEAIPVRHLGVQGVSDESICSAAERRKSSIVTKEGDFAARRARVKHGPQIVWLRIGNSTKARLMIWLEPVWPKIEEELRLGTPVFEVR